MNYLHYGFLLIAIMLILRALVQVKNIQKHLNKAIDTLEQYATEYQPRKKAS